MSDNRRDDFRVELTVPIKWKILTDDEIQVCKNGMGNTLFKQGGIPSPIEAFLDETPRGSNEEQIFMALQFLNNKLDYLIEQVLSDSSRDLYKHGNIIEISASGLKFVSKEPHNKGALVKMEVVLPGIVQYSMELITEILRATKKGEKYIIAAKIVCIKDDDRDSIVKLIFQKQRMNIRSAKNPEEN